MINEFIKQEIIPHFEYGTFIDGEGLWKGEFENTKIFYIEVPESEAIATSVLSVSYTHLTLPTILLV